MHLKLIEVDGFKSYAVRTVIGPFDEKFNAITGLNGSGKSNILDAICFVMGITQLSQVRVANLQELVYKQGQAGVRTATVTLVFDNRDPAQQPVGYTEPELAITRTIVVGGRNKYLINGHNAQAQQVANLFRSVGLNVNNPHFLIMQGRITKVLNMKPQENRDMLQEVIGTLMYETKREEAEKKMASKDIKVKAIEDTLNLEITPRVEKLREERAAYVKFSAANQELSRLTRFLAAYAYCEALKSLSGAKDELVSIADTMAAIKTSRAADVGEAKLLQRQTDELVKRRAGDAQGPLEAAAAIEKKEAQELVRVSAAKDSAAEVLATETQQLKDTEARMIELEAQSASSKIKSETSKQDGEQAQAAVKEARRMVEENQRAVESAESGFGTSERVDMARTALNEASTQQKRAQLQVQHLTSELKQLDKDIAAETKTANKAGGGITDVSGLQTQIKTLQDELHALVNGDKTEAQIMEELAELQKQARDIRASLAGRFDFGGNSKNGKVHGPVAKLLHLTQEPDKYAVAIEVVAGAKLFHVVVDDVDTGKALLKSKLQQRVTIIPLDVISTRVADEKVLSRVPSGATLALSLVGYEPDVRAAMEHVFGTTMVCDTIETARTVAFDKNIKMRAVTLDGDVFDPSGTLTGGSRAPSSSSGGSGGSTNLLLRLHQLAQLENQMKQTESLVKQMRESTKTRNELQHKIDRLNHQITMAKQKEADSKLARLQTSKVDVENQLVAAKTELDRASKDVEVQAARVKELEEEVRDASQRRSKLVSDANKSLVAAKKRLKDAEEHVGRCVKFMEANANALRTTLEELAQLLGGLDKQRAVVREAETKMSQMETMFAKQKEVYQVARKNLDKRREAVSQWDVEVSALEKRASGVQDKLRESDMELKRLEGRVAKLVKDEKSFQGQLDGLVAAHQWIESEKQFFNKPHTEYDFEERDPTEAQARFKMLEETQSKLSRNINKKAQGMMDKAEAEYEELDKKRRIIEKDKMTIERVMGGLDKKKNEALIQTYEKVNTDFGAIFSTLLPGARAELRPPEGQTVLEGLEVRVAFGTTWKESLTELSGGQRSLLALSLVLALLKFKPAPMYILDEIDAALDLSHTQNIGALLRQHFSQSQFIVVSLKEGMFANADVVFRTKFVDGVSTVSRTVNNQRSRVATTTATTSSQNTTATATTTGDVPQNKGSRKRAHKATTTGQEDFDENVASEETA